MRRLTVVALAVALASLAGAAAALAGPPSHPQAFELSGFDHACGTAVDSEGDIYVASAGESPSTIRIFDPTHTDIGSVTTGLAGKEPCGLAVDGDGNLYVSLRATHEVLRFHPTTYPFTGPPIYEPPVTIDPSGKAEGISVDPVDDRLYVAEGDHIAVYESDGLLASADEVQRVRVLGATGGTFKLSFNGSEDTVSLLYNAKAAEIETALVALPTIGAGDVAVSTVAEVEVENRYEHLITFTGALARTDVPPLGFDDSGLEGQFARVTVNEDVKGFSGFIGEGDLTDATGVAAFTSESGDRYVFAADSESNTIEIFRGPNIKQLERRGTITGPEKEEDFKFAPAGAYLAVDPGNGNPATKKCSEEKGEHACTAGHLLVYDDARKAVEEFEATGGFLDQLPNEGLVGSEPTGLAVERSGKDDDGTIYLTSGTGPGAKLLAFKPLSVPRRPPLDKPPLELSRNLPGAQAVAIDRFGDVYVSSGKLIRVFGPDGKAIALQGEGIETQQVAKDIAVDSQCNVYSMYNFGGGQHSKETMQYQAPSLGSCPPKDGTQYGAEKVVCDLACFEKAQVEPSAIGVNPANDHVSFAGPDSVIELDSAANGSKVIDPCFGCGLVGAPLLDVAAYGANGDVYVSNGGGEVKVLDPSGKEVLARIKGDGSPKGPPLGGRAIAVDQSNGHVLTFESSRGAIEEYEASGAFVAEIVPTAGAFGGGERPGIAIDNSGGPGNGNVYLAFDADEVSQPFDLFAFGPLTYSGPPEAHVELPSDIAGDKATLNGTVDPRGFEVEECHFDYIAEADYDENIENTEPPFEGAEEAPCVPGAAELGHGNGPVPVQAILSGLEAEGHYRFRLIATNEFGESKDAGLFGPPLAETLSAQPVLYDEATLRAEVDPKGLPSEYHFEYVTQSHFEEAGFEDPTSTPEAQLPAGDGKVAVQANLTGLAEGSGYRFRVVAKNAAAASDVVGGEETFETLARAGVPPCENSEYRTGKLAGLRFSASLPDCRAYELVTPAETSSETPRATSPGSTGEEFNNWLTAPRGPQAGESLAFFSSALPGFLESGGDIDGYHSTRGNEPHPAAGWTTTQVSPTYAQVGLGGTAKQAGVASDQDYWLYSIRGASESFEETLPPGEYLRTPGGVASSPCNPLKAQDRFELIGCGDLGTDPDAQSRYVSPGGAHLIFFSKVQLESSPENEAAPNGTVSIYDRKAGSSSAEVVSVKPVDGSPFGAGENATYLAATEDGTAVVFRVGGTLYVHRGGKTSAVAEGPSAFAGISSDGTRVFYAAGSSGKAPATLYACDNEAGSCLGGEPSGLTEIADNSIFANVSEDGSHAFFISEGALYAWDGSPAPHFIAVLDPQDLISFKGDLNVNLRAWSDAITAGGSIGRNQSPTRSTPDGGVFVFQSHAQLTPYDNGGEGEIYRYDPAAPTAEQMICVSCDPSGTPPGGIQRLVTAGGGGVVLYSTLVSNLTDDGQEVFFQSPDRLLPEDANDVEDVYEWKARGAGGCERPGGCLALISTGQGEEPSFLFGMSADGHDVFFETPEKLVGQDIPGSHSIYDARVDGGIPDPPAKAPCQGDACQGQGSAPPPLAAPTSSGSGDGNLPCAKGKHKVRREGKKVCVKKHSKKQHHKGKGQGSKHRHSAHKGRTAR